MRITIDWGEIWPAYELAKNGISFDIPAEKVEEWQRITAEWEKMQDEMGELINTGKESPDFGMPESRRE